MNLSDGESTQELPNIIKQLNHRNRIDVKYLLNYSEENNTTIGDINQRANN